MATVTIQPRTGPLKKHRFHSLLDLMDAQDALRSKCKHQKRFRRVSAFIVGRSNQQNVTAVVRVWCDRCKTVIEDHRTPHLQTQVPNIELKK